MTTKQYTAEDFANAEFARHPNGAVAARFDNSDIRPWFSGDDIWLRDDDMAFYGWVPVRGAEPITLDSLQAAWESAEDVDECNEGDTLIWRDVTWGYMVRRAGSAHTVGPNVRILRRAPKREPWQDLADVLAAHTGDPNPEETAKILHECGVVRVTKEGETK